MSIALRLERAGGEDARLYRDLPMGASIDGPLVGDVNAPFAVSLARDGLVTGPAEDVPVQRGCWHRSRCRRSRSGSP